MWKKWLWISIVVLVGLFLIPYSLPLIFAFITAVMLEGLVQWLMTKLRFNRLQSVITVFTGYVLLMTFIGYHLISIIAHQAVTLSGKTPNFMKDLYVSVILPLIRKWEFYSKNLPKDVIVSIEKTLEKSINSLDTFLQGVIQYTVNLLTAIPGFLIEFLIYFITLFLISLELPRLKEKMEKHLKEQTKKRVYLVTNQLYKAGIGFIKAQIVLSAVTFLMAYIGLTILKVHYTGLLSLLIVVVDILPILGTGSVLVPWAVIAILQNNHFLGIGLIVLFLFITVVRRIIEPKVYSTSLGISPLAALISLYIGFKLLGIVGVFLGPTLVIVFDTLRRANIIKMTFKI
jgi:sporulation integral membrane protein YtvI